MTTSVQKRNAPIVVEFEQSRLPLAVSRSKPDGTAKPQANGRTRPSSRVSKLTAVDTVRMPAKPSAAQRPAPQAQRAVDRDLHRGVAKMFCVGFDGTDPSVLRPLIDRGVSAVILFTRNYQSPRQLVTMCGRIKKLARWPILICIDQEGGRVARLGEPFSKVPPMRDVGRRGDTSLARAIGRLHGRELRAVNIDMNLAPVLDVDTNPKNPVIGDRSFGSKSAIVATMGVAYIRGIQSTGVAACGKHFPGHGDTSIDSHLDLPKLPHAMQRLARVELPPFAAAVKAGVAAIMTAHVIFEPLGRQTPATMSPAVIGGVLRQRMKFNGVVISDCLEMKAIADHFGIERAVTAGAIAGVDLFLVSHTSQLQHRAMDALIAAVESGQVPRSRIAQAGKRLDALFRRFVRPAQKANLSVLGSPEHLRILKRL